MPSPYVTLMRTRGGPGFSAAGAVGRLPLSMAGLAVVLLVVGQTGSYALAGSVDAVWALVGAGVAPLVARLVDRFGQRRVVPVELVVTVVSVVLLVVLVTEDLPRWTWFLTAAVAGASTPIVGSLVRARWGHLLGDSPLLRTAYSWESVVDEVVFVVGPPLAAAMAVALGAGTALLITVAIGTLGSAALLAQRRTEPPAVLPEHRHRGSVLRSPGFVAVVVVMAALGVLFAAVEVPVIATARETGHTGLGGVVLACWSAGSLIAGLLVGSRRNPWPLPWQLAVGSGLLTALLVPTALTTDLYALAVILFASGVAVSPSLIAGFGLAESLVPAGRLTEGLAWASSGIAVGFALGAPGAGWVVDRYGAQRGFLVALAAGAVATAVALGQRSALSGASAPGGGVPWPAD